METMALEPDSIDDVYDRSIEILEEPGLCVLPTDTLYSLSGKADDPELYKRIEKLKDRAGVPMAVAVPNVDEIWNYCLETPLAVEIAQKYLPGPLTLVLPAMDPGLGHLVSEEGYLGIRVVESELIRSITAWAGPITITSANLHGGPDPTSIAIAQEQLGEGIGLYVDAGELPGTASTVIKIDRQEVTVLRKGPLDLSEYL